MTTPDGGKPESADRSGGGAEPTAGSVSGWRILARNGRPRATKGNAIAVVLALGLGFAMAAQVQQTRSSGLEDLSQDNLIALLDAETGQNARLAREKDTLTDTRNQLQGSKGDAAALQAARDRLAQLGILAGTIGAKGPGIRILVADPKVGVQAATLLDTVQELRDAGAEAIQINDVRVVASTYFSTSSDNRLVVDGTAIRAPYTVLAIGDPQTMSTAMAIPGGVVSTFRQLGATAVVKTATTVTVSALRARSSARYAQPDSTPTG